MNEIGRKIANKLAELHGSNTFSIGFLPYKRSMWDSMESVYQECIKAGADAYCIPIPYYLMKGKKQIDKVISERELFNNATGTSILEERTFDYVVIHYPYDGNNLVTSMLPQFYTQELRKYGKVVFIPYSCTPGFFVKTHPGLANIDYAFLNSEQDCVNFIAEWKKLRVDFEGRVFGFGSPKIDAVKKCKHKGQTNIVLIINSLAPYLSQPFIKLNIYRQTIAEELAKGHQVIFRPHPLLRQTIKSMRPDTEEEYLKFLRWVADVGGSIDQTEYLEKALSQADILISDFSSVLDMWMTTGREYKII